MATNVYLDVQLIKDMTARWLWMLKADDGLYGAGVAMSYTDATRAGEEALALLEQRFSANKAGKPSERWATTHLNLDELERLDQEERQQRK